MCTCNSACNCSAIQFPQGPSGPIGARGEYGGYSSNWLFDANTSNGTSFTFIRLNNAAFSSVTELYINDKNADGVDLSGFLASFNNSGNFGKVRVFKETDSSVFAMFDVTAVTDNTTEYAISVSYIESNGSFSASDSIVVSFADAGSQGATGTNGTNGTNGTTILVNNTSSDATSSALPVLIGTKTYTVPAATLASDGDKLRITANLRKTTGHIAAVTIQINSNWFTTNPPALAFVEGRDEMQIVLELTRKSNTTAAADIKWIQSSSPSYTGTSYFTYENSASIGIVNFTGATFVVAVHGAILAGGTLHCEQLTIEKLAI